MYSYVSNTNRRDSDPSTRPYSVLPQIRDQVLPDLGDTSMRQQLLNEVLRNRPDNWFRYYSR